MQITFTGHQIDISDTLREMTREKFNRLQRHFDKITSVSVTFAVEKIRHIAEATIHIPGATIHASSESIEDLYSAIDTLVDKLDRQLKKHKEKETGHH